MMDIFKMDFATYSHLKYILMPKMKIFLKSEEEKISLEIHLSDTHVQWHPKDEQNVTGC